MYKRQEQDFRKSDDPQIINRKPDHLLFMEEQHGDIPWEKYKGNSDQSCPAHQKPKGNAVSLFDSVNPVSYTHLSGKRNASPDNLYRRNKRSRRRSFSIVFQINLLIIIPVRLKNLGRCV